MTDYLEELLENAASLLEEVRRTEGGRSVPALEPTARSLRSGIQRSAEAAGEADALIEEGPVEALPESGAPKEGRTEGLPLLDQVEQMERTVLAAERTSMERQASGASQAAGGRDGYPVSLPGPVRGESLSGGAEGSVSGWTAGFTAAAAPGGAEADWAERADRAFRRDSRRYDGGFYLY